MGKPGDNKGKGSTTTASAASSSSTSTSAPKAAPSTDKAEVVKNASQALRARSNEHVENFNEIRKYAESCADAIREANGNSEDVVPNNAYKFVAEFLIDYNREIEQLKRLEKDGSKIAQLRRLDNMLFDFKKEILNRQANVPVNLLTGNSTRSVEAQVLYDGLKDHFNETLEPDATILLKRVLDPSNILEKLNNLINEPKTLKDLKVPDKQKDVLPTPVEFVTEGIEWVSDKIDAAAESAKETLKALQEMPSMFKSKPRPEAIVEENVTYSSTMKEGDVTVTRNVKNLGALIDERIEGMDGIKTQRDRNVGSEESGGATLPSAEVKKNVGSQRDRGNESSEFALIGEGVRAEYGIGDHPVKKEIEAYKNKSWDKVKNLENINKLVSLSEEGLLKQNLSKDDLSHIQRYQYAKDAEAIYQILFPKEIKTQSYSEAIEELQKEIVKIDKALEHADVKGGDLKKPLVKLRELCVKRIETYQNRKENEEGKSLLVARTSSLDTFVDFHEKAFNILKKNSIDNTTFKPFTGSGVNLVNKYIAYNAALEDLQKCDKSDSEKLVKAVQELQKCFNEVKLALSMYNSSSQGSQNKIVISFGDAPQAPDLTDLKRMRQEGWGHENKMIAAQVSETLSQYLIFNPDAKNDKVFNDISEAYDNYEEAVDSLESHVGSQQYDAQAKNVHQLYQKMSGIIEGNSQDAMFKFLTKDSTIQLSNLCKKLNGAARADGKPLAAFGANPLQQDQPQVQIQQPQQQVQAQVQQQPQIQQEKPTITDDKKRSGSIEQPPVVNVQTELQSQPSILQPPKEYPKKNNPRIRIVSKAMQAAGDNLIFLKNHQEIMRKYKWEISDERRRKHFSGDMYNPIPLTTPQNKEVIMTNGARQVYDSLVLENPVLESLAGKRREYETAIEKLEKDPGNEQLKKEVEDKYSSFKEAMEQASTKLSKVSGGELGAFYKKFLGYADNQSKAQPQLLKDEFVINSYTVSSQLTNGKQAFDNQLQYGLNKYDQDKQRTINYAYNKYQKAYNEMMHDPACQENEKNLEAVKAAYVELNDAIAEVLDPEKSMTADGRREPSKTFEGACKALGENMKVRGKPLIEKPKAEVTTQHHGMKQ